MVALFDQRDRFHGRFRRLIIEADGPVQMHTTWPCVTEASHLLGPRLRVALLQWIGSGAVEVFPFDAPDLLEMCAWIRRYTQLPRTEMDLADASLVVAALKTGCTDIWTLDRADFETYRLPGRKHFTLA